MNTEKPYDEVVDELLVAFKKKAKDYGSAWRILRPPSLTDQIFIKAKRMRELQDTQENKVGEGIPSELAGVALYSAMGLVQLKLGVADSPDMTPEIALGHIQDAFASARVTMLKKNHDYGEAWRRLRMGSTVDLLLQRLERMREVESNDGVTAVSEGLDANYIDLINYSIFGLIKIKEGADPMKTWKIQ